MALWIPIGLFILWRYYVNKANTGDLTPERQAVYDVAMSLTRDPGKLNVLANAFESAGLHEQAASLRKRAKIPDLSQASHEARQRAFKKALGSANPSAIRDLADAFEREGLGRAASILRDQASGIEHAAEVPPVPVIREMPPAAPEPGHQVPSPEHQAPDTQAGQNMSAPVPDAAIAAPVPPMPHGEFGMGTVIPSQYPGPLEGS